MGCLMLNKYRELTLLPDEEMDLRFLWEQTYKELHLALSSDLVKHTIGFSFPQYNERKRSLGCKLRIFSHSEANLKNFDIQRLVNNLSDNIHYSSIKNVPSDCKTYEYFSSVTIRNPSKAKRLVKRAEARGVVLDIDEVTRQFNELNSKIVLPYVNMVSNSSGNPYPLVIARKPATSQGTTIKFSSYGLSTQTPVPRF